MELGITEILKIIPHRYPFVLVDRILEMEPGKRAVGLKNVSFNEEFFQGHFPGKPGDAGGPRRRGDGPNGGRLPSRVALRIGRTKSRISPASTRASSGGRSFRATSFASKSRSSRAGRDSRSAGASRR